MTVGLLGGSEIHSLRGGGWGGGELTGINFKFTYLFVYNILTLLLGI